MSTQARPLPSPASSLRWARRPCSWLLLRLFLDADLFRYRILVEVTGLMAIFSMLAGNLAGPAASNIKRMLAYSSHRPYRLPAAIFHGQPGRRQPTLAIEAAAYYLLAYTVTTIAAFGLLTLISARAGGAGER